MDINQVRFGNYQIGNSKPNLKKNEQKDVQEESAQIVQENNTKSADANAVFDAMNIAGMQNKFQIGMQGQNEVNPLNYLSQDRIQDIEAMMEGFENGVNNVANVIEQEFPGMFAADTKNALAARIFAKE